MSVFQLQRSWSFVSPSTHLPLSLIAVHLVTPSFVIYYEHFFPKIMSKRKSYFQGQISESNIQSYSPGNKEVSDEKKKKSFRGECNPSLMLFSKIFNNSNKKTCEQSVSFERLLTAELGGVLPALSNRYHLDIFNSLCHPLSHLQTGN